MSTKQKRFILPEDEIPKYWYNIQADMKTKPMPKRKRVLIGRDSRSE